MKIVGLTGSIGMGKSETAGMFRAEGIPVFDADATVHMLQVKGGKALPAIDAAFPGVIEDGVLNRTKLGDLIFADAAAKQKLEAIIHPMVAAERAVFFEEAEKTGAPFVVMDVPLLFETSGDKACHRVIVVSAPANIQRERVLAREAMKKEKFEHILSQQMPDAEKRAKADFVVDTSQGFKHARERVRSIIKDITSSA